MKYYFFLALSLVFQLSCSSQAANEGGPDNKGASAKNTSGDMPDKNEIIVGADDYTAYLNLLEGKKTGLVVNQTSMTRNGHLVDFLQSKAVDLQAIFSPEHGFRGTADAGATVENGKDLKSGLNVYSLYGRNKKPTKEQLGEIDFMIFDIQDVGARFYTYISTLHYVMEACAENNIPLMILDRPNPNGHYVDGPIMEREFSSFVGLHPVPIVHGMTIGEYAQMINGERWIAEGRNCKLIVVRCLNYSHDTPYTLPIKPSPNLPNNKAIYLYPSLCLFEGTDISIGRGTEMQFQIFGHPDFPKEAFPFQFMPLPMQGALNPKHKGIECYGKSYLDLSEEELYAKVRLDLSPLIIAYSLLKDKDKFFSSFFHKLAGTKSLAKMIEAGVPEEEIRRKWKPALESFKKKREKYLLYK